MTLIETKEKMRALLYESIGAELSLDDIHRIADELIENGVVVPVRCKDCIYAKEVKHRGGIVDWSFKCTYLKPNTNMFDCDFCRYGREKENG